MDPQTGCYDRHKRSLSSKSKTGGELIKKEAVKWRAVIDTREQKPLHLKAGDIEIPTVSKSLPTGDYSIEGLEHLVAIERKSLDDLGQCLGRDRERFERELQRLKAYQTRALVVECRWCDIVQGNYKANVHPNSAIGSIMGWMADGLPIIFAESHPQAGVMVSRMLWVVANRRLKELKFLGAS